MTAPRSVLKPSLTQYNCKKFDFDPVDRIKTTRFTLTTQSSPLDNHRCSTNQLLWGQTELTLLSFPNKIISINSPVITGLLEKRNSELFIHQNTRSFTYWSLKEIVHLKYKILPCRSKHSVIFPVNT